MKNPKTVVDISTNTFIKVVIFLLVLAFLYMVREAIVLIFIALVMGSALDPFVDWMQKHKIPRGVGLIFLYIILFAILSSSVILIIPPITTELKLIANDFPHYYSKVVEGFNYLTTNRSQIDVADQMQGSIGALTSNLSQTASGIFSTVIDIFGGLFSFVLVLVITFYFTVEEDAIKRFVKSVSPVDNQPYLMNLINRIQTRLGYWLRGQLILCLVIFSLTFIGLTSLGVDYALVLAMIAGLTEVIPYLGPIIGATPAVFLALAQSPLKALIVVLMFVIIQQIEAHIIVPKVMSKSVGINPLIVIIVMLVGGKLGGIPGIILAVPVASGLSVFLEDVFSHREGTPLIEETEKKDASG